MSNGFANGFANVSENNAGEALNNLASNLVKVIHGSADGSFPVAGHTVSAARATFAQSYNIPSDAVAFVNGVKVGEDYISTPTSLLSSSNRLAEKANCLFNLGGMEKSMPPFFLPCE